MPPLQILPVSLLVPKSLSERRHPSLIRALLLIPETNPPRVPLQYSDPSQPAARRLRDHLKGSPHAQEHVSKIPLACRYNSNGRQNNICSGRACAQVRSCLAAVSEERSTKLSYIALKDRWPAHWRSFKEAMGGKFPRTTSLIATATSTRWSTTLTARIIVWAPTLGPSGSNMSAARPTHWLRLRPPLPPR